MAIPARLLRSLLPALVSVGLVVAACSSDSDDSPGPGQIDDPKPSDGGSDGNGGSAGSPSTPSEAGTPAESEGGTGATGVGGETEPGTGGTPPDPGTAGAGGGADGPAEPTAGFIHGNAIYTEKCVICHQADLGGAGFYPNISADMVNGIGSWSDEEMGNAITKGLDTDGSKLCSFMIPVTDMSSADLADLIEYLRGAPTSSRKITSACPI